MAKTFGYTFYEDLCTQCEAEIQSLLVEMTKDLPIPQDITPPRPIRHNVPKIDNLHTKLVTLTQGSDVARISGLSPVSFLKLMGEVGTNLSTFPTEKHFTSWAGLAPRKHQSGKMSKHKKNAKTVVGQIFREAAQSFATSKHLALGAFYRRIAARSGSFVANVATARKLAIQFYRVMTKGNEFVEQGLQKYQEQYQAKIEFALRKKAAELGFAMVP